MLRVIVLGAAAGGGVPQWNCGCPICRRARLHPEMQSTQASIAFSVDDTNWFLVNASPDLRQQLIATAHLHPKAGELRHTPIAGVILTMARSMLSPGSCPCAKARHLPSTRTSGCSRS